MPSAEPTRVSFSAAAGCTRMQLKWHGCLLPPHREVTDIDVGLLAKSKARYNGTILHRERRDDDDDTAALSSNDPTPFASSVFFGRWRCVCPLYPASFTPRILSFENKYDDLR
mmetsp:Transcript_41931/g.42513  ORF Transcript_41931/g.42513 Transcript_41931/m.42513 type:complete len:113 (-) Transcript_41931:166-504(-)